MTRAIEILFLVWVLSFLFERQDLIGTLSLDNLLAPLLLLLWPLYALSLPRGQGEFRMPAIFGILLLFLAFFLAQTGKLLMADEIVWAAMYNNAVALLYAILPVLYLGSRTLYRRTGAALLLVTAVGCLTVFLAAIGVLHLEDARLGEQRIEGLEIQRATGLISVYGDLALMMAFSLITLLALRRDTSIAWRRPYLVLLLVGLTLLALGLIGAQSRNILVTLLAALAAYLWLRLCMRTQRWTPIFYTGIVGASLIVFAAGLFFFTDIVNLLAGLGGQAAEGTARGRLDQYTRIMELLDGRYWNGAEAEVLARNADSIRYTHNLWLKELARAGLIGVGLLLLLILTGLHNAVNQLRQAPDSALARARVVTVFALLVATQFYPSGSTYFWFLLGVVLVPASRPGATPLPASGGRQRAWTPPPHLLGTRVRGAA